VDGPNPLSLERIWEDSESVINEVTQSRQSQLAQRGIDVSAVFNGPLPELSLGSQFREAFERVIEFSSTILPEGGALRVVVGPRCIDDSHYVELRVINDSPTQLEVQEKDVFRPYLKVNDCESASRCPWRGRFSNVISAISYLGKKCEMLVYF
jgi:hypothetical protein